MSTVHVQTKIPQIPAGITLIKSCNDELKVVGDNYTPHKSFLKSNNCLNIACFHGTCTVGGLVMRIVCAIITSGLLMENQSAQSLTDFNEWKNFTSRTPLHTWKA